MRCADVIYVKTRLIYPSAYPSEFSDLIEGAVQNNVTIVADEAGTVIDGKLLTGGVMYYLENQKRFTWGKFEGFTFRNFNKLIMSRQHSYFTSPEVIFQDCIFENNTHDLFSTSGGHWIFINCIFRKNAGRAFKALSETSVEFVDCTFEDCQAVFGFGSDLMFRNCLFIRCFGQRGGAIHAAKSTLYVTQCKFIETLASANGGAIYIRDSHEKYQSEISNNCFLNTKSEMNGTAIYSYLSHVEIAGNIFSNGDESYYEALSNVNFHDNTMNGNSEACVRDHRPLNEVDLYFPCDTYQRHETDDMNGSIVINFENPEDPLEQIIQ